MTYNDECFGHQGAGLQSFQFAIQKRAGSGTLVHLFRLLVQFSQSNLKERWWGLSKWSRHLTKSEWAFFGEFGSFKFWEEVETWPGACIVHLLGCWPDTCPQLMEQLQISPGPQSISPCWLVSFLPCPGWAAASWPPSRNQFLPDIVWGWQQPCLGQEGRRYRAGCHQCTDGSAACTAS